MTFSFVYITAADMAEAKKIGRVLVEERLAACANSIPGMESVYRWQGEIETGSEVVLFVKTRSALVDAVAERVKQLHSYDCPCVVSWPVGSGSPEYLQWIRDNTRG
ncbi:MAG: divalent cation tolerance protein CutA [Chitinivibrionales bacterium]|nr:divalent cation tolerance protein CutA [Chitinivibrionales bacterium]MBD3394621.1 divalent cation tolerance protein CutA [Chitinivibrionales bacterium]